MLRIVALLLIAWEPLRFAGEALRVFRERLDSEARTVVVHANPVFDANDFSPRALTPFVPTIGVRDASDLPTMLAFARFAAVDAALDGLDEFLQARVAEVTATIEPLAAGEERP